MNPATTLHAPQRRASARGASSAAPAVGDDIRRQLEHDIASGLLAPGARLDVKMVAERFGVSRTPAREALLQLSAAGLIDFQPRRGGHVTGLEPAEVLAMIEVLVVLESQAARLSARRMDDAQRDALLGAHREATASVAAGDSAAYADANLRLHQLIYQGSRNAYLSNQILQLRGRLAAHHPVSFERPGRMKSSHAEHHAIVQAVAQGDEEAAELAMTRHITVGGTAQAEILLRWASAPASAR